MNESIFVQYALPLLTIATLIKMYIAELGDIIIKIKEMREKIRKLQ